MTKACGRRRKRVSQLALCGEGCFDSRRCVNSNVRQLTIMRIKAFLFLILLLVGLGPVITAQRLRTVDDFR
jgi:hypothetical protein